MYKGRLTLRLGMVNIEIMILAGLTVFNILWAGLLTRITIKSIQSSAIYLDKQLAQALQSLVEETINIIPADVEPPNPLVAVFADYLKQSMKLPKGAEKLDSLSRDSAGKFQSDNL
jgi:hypothetical protein